MDTGAEAEPSNRKQIHRFVSSSDSIFEELVIHPKPNIVLVSDLVFLLCPLSIYIDVYNVLNFDELLFYFNVLLFVLLMI